jgi:hypothetical protein
LVDRLPLDQARLRPHLRERWQLISLEARVFAAKAERSTGDGVVTSPQWKVPVGDDLQRLRGLPCVAPGVHGVAPGSDPVRELLAKERRRR